MSNRQFTQGLALDRLALTPSPMRRGLVPHVLAAAEFCEEHPERWTRGQRYTWRVENTASYDEPIGACAIGAIETSILLERQFWSDDEALVNAACASIDGLSLPEYNDAPHRTPREVAIRLRQVAHRLAYIPDPEDH